MVANNPLLASEVLRLKGGKMTLGFARQVLRLEVSPTVQRCVSALLEKNQEGTISAEDRDWLQACVILGDVVDLLKAEAHVVLFRKKKRRQRVA